DHEKCAWSKTMRDEFLNVVECNARFVDLIHSDALQYLGAGIIENCGHLDFWPNNGHNHPGCSLSWVTGFFSTMNGFGAGLTCNHIRAVDFYVASINPNNPIGVAHQCQDYDSYLAGDCDANCADSVANCAIIGQQAVLSEPYKKNTVGTVAGQSQPPLTAQQFTTKFNLYTRNNPGEAEVIEEPSGEGSVDNFDSTRVTKILVHGYGVAPDKGQSWQTMKDEYLNAGDYNVFIVDWSEGNIIPSYVQSESGLILSKVHIVGHSLGAHVSGLTGKKFGGRLGRISGLDPAGPTFDGKPATEKLSATDAQFVDAIHTNAIPTIGLGIHENSGQIDFYPDGGNTNQPGCVVDEPPKAGDKDQFQKESCNHFRAIDLFVASINPENPKGVSSECSDYKRYVATKGQCNRNMLDYFNLFSNDIHPIIGEPAVLSKSYKSSTLGKKFYLTTRAEYPYFLG
ncbi:unnamed protein product, partial [Medioppia subpectinata]